MDQLPPLDNTFGAVFIGVILGGVLYGISCAQVFYYFQHYSKKDDRGTKAIVVATLVFDTVHQALISHTIYTYVVTYYFQPQKLGILVWSPAIAILFSAIVAFLVQTFYAVRIWRFSQKNLIIAAPLSIFIVGQFVSSIVYVAKAIKMTMLADIAKLMPLSITMNTLAVAGDILITIVFCALLRRARTNIKRSNTMINFLITFTIQTGMLTSLCAVAALISIIVSPDTFIYISFYFLLGRLYCNSLLATLNVRGTAREKGHSSFGISLRPVEESHSSIVINRKDMDIKTGIAGVETHGYITGIGSRDGNGSSLFVPSMTRTGDSQAVYAESELESGRSHRPEHLSF